TANLPQRSSLYSGPRPTNPKSHSDWTTKRVPLTRMSNEPSAMPYTPAIAAAAGTCAQSRCTTTID
ncbi:hypothetical protein, partial [Mycolicibacterium frederiksbergense]|uniref:hypothetical protein n=1 Tax=Mycolicibacterium frederiksbergense TaxID=117567 RepID=UPI0021F27E8C